MSSIFWSFLRRKFPSSSISPFPPLAESVSHVPVKTVISHNTPLNSHSGNNNLVINVGSSGTILLQEKPVGSLIIMIETALDRAKPFKRVTEGRTDLQAGQTNRVIEKGVNMFTNLCPCRWITSNWRKFKRRDRIWIIWGRGRFYVMSMSVQHQGHKLFDTVRL